MTLPRSWFLPALGFSLLSAFGLLAHAVLLDVVLLAEKATLQAPPAQNVGALIDRLASPRPPCVYSGYPSRTAPRWSLIENEIEDIVSAGPAAIPCLLRSLEDRRPTAVSSVRAALGAALRYGWVYDRNLRRGDEGVPTPEVELRHVPRGTHAVTVGDACFYILGRIVNRRFDVAHPDGEGGQILTSPTASPEFAAHLRSEWGATTAASLRDQLFLDARRPSDADRRDNAARLLLRWFRADTSEWFAAQLEDISPLSASGDLSPGEFAGFIRAFRDLTSPEADERAFELFETVTDFNTLSDDLFEVAVECAWRVAPTSRWNALRLFFRRPEVLVFGRIDALSPIQKRIYAAHGENIGVRPRSTLKRGGR